MGSTKSNRETFAKMSFALVYPMYLAKVEKKGRTQEELHQVITWLTSFDDKKIQDLIEEDASFDIFFSHAALNPNAKSTEPDGDCYCVGRSGRRFLGPAIGGDCTAYSAMCF